MTRTLTFRAALIILSATLLSADVCCATQHLVRPGSSWQRLDERIKPGDEIILMPGRHKPVTLEFAQGTPDAPIIIKGVDPNNPSVIDAERYGLRLLDPRYVRIMNVEIIGATINGLSLEGSTTGEKEVSGPSGRVIIRNVSITDTGPRGQRHAILLQRLEGANIEGCTIDGWGGSGVEVVACTEVTIEDCRFTGKEDYSQVSGVRLRAGTDRATIQRCTFTNVGDQGVCIGGGSKMEEFATPPPSPADPDSCFEASRVNVLRCVFRRGRCALAFAAAEGATVRNCTIVRPSQAVISVRREQKDPRFGAAANCVFGSCIITWQPGDLKTLAHLGKDSAAEGLTLEENIWWTPNWEEVKESLGPFPGTILWDQITNLDPRLDDQLVPAADNTQSFGARER
jgi:hypothetical protein